MFIVPQYAGYVKKKKAHLRCRCAFLSDECQKDKVQNKQCCANPKDRIDLFHLALAGLHYNVEDKSCRDAIGNAITKSHEKCGEECGQSLVKVVPINIFEG